MGAAFEPMTGGLARKPSAVTEGDTGVETTVRADVTKSALMSCSFVLETPPLLSFSRVCGEETMGPHLARWRARLPLCQSRMRRSLDSAVSHPPHARAPPSEVVQPHTPHSHRANRRRCLAPLLVRTEECRPRRPASFLAVPFPARQNRSAGRCSARWTKWPRKLGAAAPRAPSDAGPDTTRSRSSDRCFLLPRTLPFSVCGRVSAVAPTRRTRVAADATVRTMQRFAKAAAGATNGQGGTNQTIHMRSACHRVCLPPSSAALKLRGWSLRKVPWAPLHSRSNEHPNSERKTGYRQFRAKGD